MKSLSILIVSTLTLNCLSELTVTKSKMELLSGAIFTANFAYPDHEADFEIEMSLTKDFTADLRVFRFSWKSGHNKVYQPGDYIIEEPKLHTGFLNHVDNEIYVTVRAATDQADIFINDFFVAFVPMRIPFREESGELHIMISHPGEYFGDVFVPGHPFLDIGDNKLFHIKFGEYIKLVMLFFIVFNVLNTFASVNTQAYVGILENVPSIVTSCRIALADARAAGVVSSDLILLNGTGCSPGLLSDGTAWAAESYFKHNVNLFITDSCSVENFGISRLARFWNVPVFLRSDFALTLFDPIMFPTVVHMADMTCISAALAIEKVAEALGRTELTLVGPYLQNQKSESLHIGIYNYLTLLNTINATHVDLDENNWGSMGDWILSVRTPVQLIVIDGNFANPNTAFDKIGVMGLVNDGYLVIWICKNAVQQCQTDLKERAFDTKILLMSSYYPNWELIVDQMKTKLGSQYSSDYATGYVNTYTTCYTLAIAYQRTGSYDGVAISNTFKSATFTNAPFGELVFDANAARLPSTIFAWKPSKSEALSQAYVIQTTRSACNNQRCYDANLVTINGTIWYNERNQTLQECVYKGGCTRYWIIAVVIVGVILVSIGVGVAVVCIRYKRNKPYRMHLKIARSEIKVIESKRDEGIDDISNTRVDSAKSGLATKRRIIGAYAIYNFSKADIFVFHQKKPITFSDKDLKFFAELKKSNHDNIINFIGFCYNDGPKFYVLHTLVDRASLSDFVYDKDFELDDTFKSAFLRDILNGIGYLHRSQIKFHGLLTLSNCLIDSNWVLKLTNYGITRFLNRYIKNKSLKVVNTVPKAVYHHIAPEFLKDIEIGNEYPNGDEKGDIWSFGMILYQLMFRQKPFSEEKSTFDKLKKGELLPVVADYEDDEDPLVEIMEKCWKYEPAQRPQLAVIVKVLRIVFKSMKGNLVDQMIRMNEKHAVILENIVAERGALLQKAQEQTDRLLCEILPPSIANQLKTDGVIEPRFYDSVTVLFCQLVDFLYIQTNLTPNDVVNFLNDVFTLFDDVIRNHDAYKVETTGETYMVASGVPTENENRHVFEISEVALEFRECSYSYRLEALPSFKLQLRIGYHCGPIAAGVIGLKAPRFCLFGDTVNFASRMQSNCPPNQIQMSESTALQLMVIDEYKLTKRGIVTVKGKGDVNTYWLNEHIHEHPDTNQLAHAAAAASGLTLPVKRDLARNSIPKIFVAAE
uniref:guanylate cyclase n=1 Tax=Panagrellus redivivus TaxID=6233 RepID=A0A7E4ZPX8_PANRE